MKENIHTLKMTTPPLAWFNRAEDICQKMTQATGLLVLCMQVLEIRILFKHLQPHVAASQISSSLPTAANKWQSCGDH